MIKIIVCFLVIVCVCGVVNSSHVNDISEAEKPSCIGKIFSFLWGLIYYPIYFLWLCVYWLAMGIYYAGYYIIKALWYIISGAWNALKWLALKLYWILEKILTFFKDVKNWFEDFIFSTFGAVIGTIILTLIGIYVIKPAKNYANKTYEESGAKEIIDNTADYAKEKFDEVKDTF